MAWTRRQFLSATTVLGAAFTAGCAQSVAGTPRRDPAAKRRPTTSGSAAPPAPALVTVGIMAYQPYTIEDEGGELTGPVPDVARAVLQRLGIGEVKFQIMSQEDQLLTALLAGAVDIGGGLTIRPDLCGNLAFTAPDHVSGTAFAVATGNPKGLKTYADVIAKNAKVAVWGGLPEDKDAVAAGVPEADIVRMPDPVQLLEAVRAGQADCFAFDDISVRDMVNTHGEGVEVADPFMPEGRLPLIGAYCFPKNKADLLPSFNNALLDLHASGDWGAMVAPFGFTEFNAPQEDLTTEKACTEG